MSYVIYFPLFSLVLFFFLEMCTVLRVSGLEAHAAKRRMANILILKNVETDVRKRKRWEIFVVAAADLNVVQPPS